MLFAAALLPAADLDRDGIDDALEQKLLEQFAPAFRISPGDCDGAPSEFKAGVATPTVKAKNGQIYGQVLQVEKGVIEVHYYHLWSRDCGGQGTSHPLDAESVSARLVGTEGKWQATHWYAAAHEDTLCDVSNGAAAATLLAVQHGPKVWISRDKHASFLSEELCAKSGCGKDDCLRSIALRPQRIVNLGEPGAPMNGSDWIASGAWPLAGKMQPDFTPALLARLDTGAVETAAGRTPGAQTTIRIAGNTYQSLENANHSAANGLASARNSTSKALGKSASATGRALKRAWRSIPSIP